MSLSVDDINGLLAKLQKSSPVNGFTSAQYRTARGCSEHTGQNDLRALAAAGTIKFIGRFPITTIAGTIMRIPHYQIVKGKK